MLDKKKTLTGSSLWFRLRAEETKRRRRAASTNCDVSQSEKHFKTQFYLNFNAFFNPCGRSVSLQLGKKLVLEHLDRAANTRQS